MQYHFKKGHLLIAAALSRIICSAAADPKSKGLHRASSLISHVYILM